MYNIIISIIQKKIATSLNDNATVTRAFCIHPLLCLVRTMYPKEKKKRKKKKQRRSKKTNLYSLKKEKRKEKL